MGGGSAGNLVFTERLGEICSSRIGSCRLPQRHLLFSSVQPFKCLQFILTISLCPWKVRHRSACTDHRNCPSLSLSFLIWTMGHQAWDHPHRKDNLIKQIVQKHFGGLEGCPAAGEVVACPLSKLQSQTCSLTLTYTRAHMGEAWASPWPAPRPRPFLSTQFHGWHSTSQNLFSHFLLSNPTATACGPVLESCLDNHTASS